MRPKFITCRESDTRNYFCPPYIYIPLSIPNHTDSRYLKNKLKKKQILKYRSHKSITTDATVKTD